MYFVWGNDKFSMAVSQRVYASFELIAVRNPNFKTKGPDIQEWNCMSSSGYHPATAHGNSKRVGTLS